MQACWWYMSCTYLVVFSKCDPPSVHTLCQRFLFRFANEVHRSFHNPRNLSQKYYLPYCCTAECWILSHQSQQNWNICASSPQLQSGRLLHLKACKLIIRFAILLLLGPFSKPEQIHSDDRFSKFHLLKPYKQLSLHHSPTIPENRWLSQVEVHMLNAVLGICRTSKEVFSSKARAWNDVLAGLLHRPAREELRIIKPNRVVINV